jgi:hypothetical protein
VTCKLRTIEAFRKVFNVDITGHRCPASTPAT